MKNEYIHEIENRFCNSDIETLKSGTLGYCWRVKSVQSEPNDQLLYDSFDARALNSTSTQSSFYNPYWNSLQFPLFKSF